MMSGAIILAAGSGRRFHSNGAARARPKQFLPFEGEPLFMRSLRVFGSVPSVKEIVIVHPRGFEALVRRLLARARWKKPVRLVEGGPYRGASVRNGVLALSPRVNVVLVHDSARPMVTRDIVRRVERAALRDGAAMAAWPLPDTLKLSSPSGRVRKTIPRRNLWLAQTPQGFRRDVAVKCLLNSSPSATDDAQLAEKKGFKVRLVPGASTNLKITRPEDLRLCRALL